MGISAEKNMSKILDKQAAERLAYKLDSNELYLKICDEYRDHYENRAPADSVPNRNMIRALRMLPWQNTAREWARLHITELYLQKQRNLKKTLLAGRKYKAIGT